MAETKLIEPEHIGDGLYMRDNGWNIAIAVNHHENEVAFIDSRNIDTAIIYLTRVRERLNQKKVK
jgi:hypothetical protein